MANGKNLRPRDLTNEEAVKMGRQGGVASGQARRERRRLREYAASILALPVTEENMLSDIRNAGLQNMDCNYAAMTVLALIQKACSGDTIAFRELRSLIGEEGNTRTMQIPSDGLFAAIKRGLDNSNDEDS
ncbi:hypothetical protein LJC56_11970 [Christensenellaceae bacterium OttesenSCG-928-K19]|nr:hypothetical protein [Christensenellaceae bacterium OttesenSCG-928-K19]